jgi:hypothetical protein
MPAIPLTSGAYSSAAYIANAQRCVNMFPEKNPDDTHPATPVTHLARPGLIGLSSATGVAAPAAGRCLYRSTQGVADPSGDLFAVVGSTVYFIDPDFAYHPLGTIQTGAITPAFMSDNGKNILLVDGSSQGYIINISSKSFNTVSDANFLGSTAADFIDSFIILNKPGTNQWYCTLSESVSFNALFIGIKTAWPDIIYRVVAIEREVLILGPQKGEIWYNAGTTPFPFQILPGIIIEQGCVAPYSVAKMDTNVYWLSESPEGARMIMKMNAQNVAQRISTHGQEKEFLTYARVDDAIGSTYQIEGHSFYRLTFPTADKTWVYDEATGQPWEDNWLDTNGVLHRARNTFTAYAYGKNLGLDWNTGQLYEMDMDTNFDNGQPIPWIRSFPHIVSELNYVNHKVFIADVETGKDSGTGETVQFSRPWSPGFNQGFGPNTQTAVPEVRFRYSKDGGINFSKYRPKQGMAAGEYRAMMRWRGCGIARDMVFELSSTKEMSQALNGAFIDPIRGGA